MKVRPAISLQLEVYRQRGLDYEHMLNELSDEGYTRQEVDELASRERYEALSAKSNVQNNMSIMASYPTPLKDIGPPDNNLSSPQLSSKIGNQILIEKRKDLRVIAYPVVALLGLKIGWGLSDDLYALLVLHAHNIYFLSPQDLSVMFADHHYSDYRLVGAIVGCIMALIITKFAYLFNDRRRYQKKTANH